jgi:hypothetical protein
MVIATPSAACKPKSAEILKICEFLRENGIQFAIPGWYFISPELVVRFVEDSDDAYAIIEGTKDVSQEDIDEYHRIHDCQCHAIHPNGRRCRAQAFKDFHLPNAWVSAGKPAPMCQKHGGK